MRLFSSRLTPKERRLYRALFVYYTLVAAALVWPVYPLFSGARPSILGLPLSLFYPAAILVASFSVLLSVFLWEGRRQNESSRRRDDSG